MSSQPVSDGVAAVPPMSADGADDVPRSWFAMASLTHFELFRGGCGPARARPHTPGCADPPGALFAARAGTSAGRPPRSCPPSSLTRQTPHHPGERPESVPRSGLIIRARARRSIRLDTAKARVIQPARLERGFDERIPIWRNSFAHSEVVYPKSHVAKSVWWARFHPGPRTKICCRARFHPGPIVTIQWRTRFHPAQGTAWKAGTRRNASIHRTA